MKQRPIGPLVDALTANGARIDYVEGFGGLPLQIEAGGLDGGHIELAATVSSQYVSSILLCAPYAKEQVTLELTGGQVISQPYIDMTIAMMAEFGITVERQKDGKGKLLDIYTIPKGIYANPSDYSVESDASSATYPLAIAAITGTTCTISNIGSSSLQGDARFAKEVLEPMGCTVEQTATSTTVTGPPVGQLRTLGNVDMEPMTDAFLTASALAAVAALPCLTERQVAGLRPVGSRIYGIANQRVKECNRIKAMRDQLGKPNIPEVRAMCANCLQLSLELKQMSLRMGSLCTGEITHHSRKAPQYTVMMITGLRWLSVCWHVSSMELSSRRRDVWKRLGQITGMICKIRRVSGRARTNTAD